MAASNIQLAVNTFLYFFIFVCGFAISIPLGVTTSKFYGHCLLYSTINPVNSTHFWMTFGQNSNCDFPIYVGVCGCILYGLAMGIFNVYNIYKSRKDPLVLTQTWVLGFIFINSIGSIIMLVCSCVISVGFKKLCDGLTAERPYKFFSSCRQAQQWRIWLRNEGKYVSMNHFYDNIEATQISSWICTLSWTMLVLSGIIRFVLNRRLRA